MDPLLLGFIILSIATLILLGLVIWMYIKLHRFLIGINSHNISDSLNHVSNNLKDLQGFRNEMETYLTSVEKRLRKSVQSVHTVRFNPFKGVGAGGNQSFATAFLTEEGDGVIISSLYSRDHVSVFSKPIKNHLSEHEMSDEEKEALDKAKNNL
ncbi:MAG: DUF4446 family protein [Candidatus Paceibacterota bacterium]|jgi:hypothetical protein